MSASPPAAATRVGSQSSAENSPSIIVPGLMAPGQRAMQGTRTAPSQLVSFSERNGEAPPSGHWLFIAPLSVE